MRLPLLRRDLLLTARRPGELLVPLAFFTATVAIFPLAIGTRPETLRAIAPGVIWTVALLSSLLSQDMLFRRDARDGSLDQLLLSPRPLILAVLAKAAAHWLACGLPLIFLAPLLAAWMQLPADRLLLLLATLPLGTAVFSLLAVFAEAVAAAAARSRFLGGMLALPLCMPAVIFAAAAVAGDAPAAPLLLLAACLSLALTVLPLAAAGALRASAQGM